MPRPAHSSHRCAADPGRRNAPSARHHRSEPLPHQSRPAHGPGEAPAAQTLPSRAAPLSRVILDDRVAAGDPTFLAQTVKHTLTPAEAEGLATEPLLHLQRQAVHPALHVRHAAHDPDIHPSREGDHRGFNTPNSVARCAGARNAGIVKRRVRHSPKI